MQHVAGNSGFVVVVVERARQTVVVVDFAVDQL